MTPFGHDHLLEIEQGIANSRIFQTCTHDFFRGRAEIAAVLTRRTAEGMVYVAGLFAEYGNAFFGQCFAKATLAHVALEGVETAEHAIHCPFPFVVVG